MSSSVRFAAAPRYSRSLSPSRFSRTAVSLDSYFSLALYRTVLIRTTLAQEFLSLRSSWATSRFSTTTTPTLVLPGLSRDRASS